MLAAFDRPVAPLLACAVLACAACRSGARTVVIDAPMRAGETGEQPGGFAEVSLEPASSARPVPREIAARFEEDLRARTWNAQAPGKRLRVEYRLVNLDGDDTRTGWIRAGRPGHDLVRVDVVFRNESGNELARIRAVGYRESGLFGGSLEDAVREAADEVADYALMHFLRGQQPSE